VRSLTSSVSHAFDSIAHYIEPHANPVGHTDKEKLVRTANVGFHEAAKAEQVVSAILFNLVYVSIFRMRSSSVPF
jgi:hypothetical protein